MNSCKIVHTLNLKSKTIAYNNKYIKFMRQIIYVLKQLSKYTCTSVL